MNHILVVDDEPLMRTWLSKSIPKHSTCFDVPNTAQDGIEAIEQDWTDRNRPILFSFC